MVSEVSKPLLFPLFPICNHAFPLLPQTLKTKVWKTLFYLGDLTSNYTAVELKEACFSPEIKLSSRSIKKRLTKCMLCRYLQTPLINRVDIFIVVIREAHQQVIYLVWLEPPSPIRSIQQRLGKAQRIQARPGGGTSTDVTELA